MNKKALKIALQSTLVVGALGGTFGLVYGLATIHKHSDYIDLDSTSNNQINYKDDTPTKTMWNVDGSDTPFECPIDQTPRGDYSKQVIDGTNHEILDKSFNQSAYYGEVNWKEKPDWTPKSPDSDFMTAEAFQQFTKQNPTWGWGKPTTDQTNGFIQTYAAAVTAGAKSLVLPGYLHSEPLTEFESRPEFSKAGYILIDSNIKNNNHIASVMFRADQSAFLAGLAACDYLSLNEHNFEHYIQKGPLAVGTYGGTAIPTVTIFMGGFERAVQYFNNNIIPVCKDKFQWNSEQTEQHKIHFINLGEQDSFFSGTFTIGDGRSVTQELLAKGADVIMPVAGPQTIDTVQEIKNQKSDCIVIGVDTNQEDSDMNETSVYNDESGSPYQDKIIKFSAEKNISYITSSILYLASNGQTSYLDEAGNVQIGSYGYLTVGDIDNKGCRVSEGGQDYVVHLLQNYIDDKLVDYTTALNEFKNLETNNPIKFIDDNMFFNF